MQPATFVNELSTLGDAWNKKGQRGGTGANEGCYRTPNIATEFWAKVTRGPK